jgi:hypothetical protein
MTHKSLGPPAATAWGQLDATMREGSFLMWRTALAFLCLSVLCLGLMLADPRQFQGISVWAKPAKFFLSLAVHLATLTAALLLHPREARSARAVRLAAAVTVAMSAFEMAYIMFRAARAEASHFNTASPLAEFMYGAMGTGAVLIMLATAAIGVLILRQGPPGLLARTTGLSFLAAAAATIWTGLAIGGMGSHWIGGDRTDATGLPFLGWSTTGGDLRSAHFLGLHVMQVLPALALTGRPGIVGGAAILYAAAFVAAVALAINGLPLVSAG